MGAMYCHREGCTNAMCQRYSERYGYICYDCFEELTKSQTLDIEAFMKTPKENISEKPTVDYSRVFRSLDEDDDI